SPLNEHQNGNVVVKCEAHSDHECQCSRHGHENVIVKEEADTDNNAVFINTEHRVGSQAEPNSTNNNQLVDVVVKSEADSECQCLHQEDQMVIKEEVDANTNPVDVNTVEFRPDLQSNSGSSNQELQTSIEPIKNE